MERYVQRVAERSHVTSFAPAICAEQRYVGEHGTEQRSPGLVLSYAADVVAIEVTARRPPRRTRTPR